MADEVVDSCRRVEGGTDNSGVLHTANCLPEKNDLVEA